jgi:hypothetical protein
LTRIRRHRTAFAVVAAIAALSALVVAGATAASKIKLKSGVIEATFGGGVSPKALPKKGMAPVALSLEGKMNTTDGSHIEPLETVSLEFDKAGKLETKGLASCKVGKLEATTTETAKKTCKSSLVGSGEVTALIAFPEQKDLFAKGPLLVFNGSKGGKQELILHVYAHVPAATTFVVPVQISKAHGKFGTKAFIKVPKIVGGSGSVTSFKARITKKYNSGGKKLSLLNAGCPKGSLAVNGELKFRGGTKLEGEINAPCTPKG